MTETATKIGRATPDSTGYFYMALSATGVIFLPTTAKLALQSGSDVLTVALVRGMVSTLILLLVVLLIRQELRLQPRLLVTSLIVGIASAAFVYGMYGAILSINISLALLILFLYPMGIAIWQHLSGAAKLQPQQWFWGLVACIGMTLILGVQFDSVSFIGVSLAALAMLASVVITLLNVKVVASTGSLVANLYMSLWSLIIFAVALAFFGDFRQPQTVVGWSGLVGNGFAYCVSWVAFFSGARILGATRASMITLLEPALAAMFAWVIFGETFSAPQWAGFAVVLAALFMFESRARRLS